MDSQPGSTRWIRWALVVFPTGLIVLGVISMIWHLSKKQETAERSIRYAAGLARGINAADLARLEKILSETSDPKTVASFVESTLGPENMGYTVRRVQGKSDAAERIVAFDVELTGQKKPRDVVLVISHHLPFADSAPSATGAARASALMMSVAHAVTGSPALRSIRFVSVESPAALLSYYEAALGAGERISHVVVLGQLAAMTDDALFQPLHLNETGAVIVRPALDADAVAAAKALRSQVMELADRL